MVQKIIGVISDATAVENFSKKDGSRGCKCILKITAISDDAYPQEVAVSVTGDNTNYSRCLGMSVEVEYINRVFEFTKEGSRRFGNDVYLHSIKAFGQQTVLEDHTESIQQ